MAIDKHDPRLRFTLVITAACLIFVVASIIIAALAGTLSFGAYLTGVSLLATSVLSGFLFIWCGCTLMKMNKIKQLDAAQPVDIPVRLQAAHPLEADLLGFLMNYRTWPLNSADPKRDTLYHDTIKKWQQVRSESDLKRIIVLSYRLAVTQAYRQQRRHPAWWQFWLKDTLSYAVIRDPHPQLSCTVLSHMPHFDALTMPERQALLYAIRYQHTHLPEQMSPLTIELHTFIRGYHKSQKRFAQS